MRSLGQPQVLRSAAVAAAATALVCYPRLAHASSLPYPMWYLEALLFLGTIVLWAFVFAWHTQYTHRPVFMQEITARTWASATVAGLSVGLLLFFFQDPLLRGFAPEDYPTTVENWLAMTLFTLAFTQLFLVFAPFAWLIRLFQRERVAVVLTVLFGAFVLVLKNYRSPAPFGAALLLDVLLVRLVVGSLSVYFFLRGGVVLVWWWGLLLQSRHLLRLGTGF